MVALATEVRRYERLERSALEGELNRWGKWLETHSEFEGYPGVNILIAFIGGGGGGIPGHRILCLDMPTDIYATHGRVIRLPEAEQEAVWLKYVTRLKPDGTLWTVRERCVKADISEDAFHQRLSRARSRILGLPI